MRKGAYVTLKEVILFYKQKKELLMQFSIRVKLNSINKKVTLKLDTGADANSLNQKTFKTLFPDVEL